MLWLKGCSKGVSPNQAALIFIFAFILRINYFSARINCLSVPFEIDRVQMPDGRKVFYLPQFTQAPTGAYINVPPMGPEEVREK